MNRPYVARELIPYGTAGTADLLNALDRRFQEGVADPAGVVALLRRMGIGDVVLRNDIQYQRYNLVAPRELNRVFEQIPGLGQPIGFGPPSPSSQVTPAPGAREEDEIDLMAARQRAAPQPRRRLSGRARDTDRACGVDPTSADDFRRRRRT